MTIVKTMDKGVYWIPISNPTTINMAAWISEVVIPPKVLPTKIVVLLTGATITLLRKSNFLSHIMYVPKKTEENMTDIQIMPGKMNC